jgi:hypothetical protein
MGLRRHCALLYESELLRAVKLSVVVFRVVMTVRVDINVSERLMASIFRSELQP